jgi:hypothetical protein
VHRFRVWHSKLKLRSSCVEIEIEIEIEIVGFTAFSRGLSLSVFHNIHDPN